MGDCAGHLYIGGATAPPELVFYYEKLPTYMLSVPQLVATSQQAAAIRMKTETIHAMPLSKVFIIICDLQHDCELSIHILSWLYSAGNF